MDKITHHLNEIKKIASESDKLDVLKTIVDDDLYNDICLSMSSTDKQEIEIILGKLKTVNNNLEKSHTFNVAGVIAIFIYMFDSKLKNDVKQIRMIEHAVKWINDKL